MHGGRQIVIFEMPTHLARTYAIERVDHNQGPFKSFGVPSHVLDHITTRPRQFYRSTMLMQIIIEKNQFWRMIFEPAYG